MAYKQSPSHLANPNRAKLSEEPIQILCFDQIEQQGNKVTCPTRIYDKPSEIYAHIQTMFISSEHGNKVVCQLNFFFTGCLLCFFISHFNSCLLAGEKNKQGVDYKIRSVVWQIKIDGNIVLQKFELGIGSIQKTFLNYVIV